MKVLIGTDKKHGEIYVAELKDDRTIRGFTGYDMVTVQDDLYKSECSWSHEALGFKTDDKLSKDFKPLNMSETEIEEFHDAYIGSISYCDECSEPHDMDDYYSPSFKIIDCELYCNDCVNSEMLLTPLTEPSELFNAKNLVDTNFENESDYEEIETLFCDSSGMGSSNEPALTQSQAESQVQDILKKNKNVELFCGLTSIGQFQVYVTIYKKVG